MIRRSDDGKVRRLSLSYGKDSLACLGALELLDKPLDKIVHAEVWATDTISADLPPMVEFKAKADKIIKERWGFDVEHIWATDKNGKKITYDSVFYRIAKNQRSTSMFKNKNNGINDIYGFPMRRGAWCNSELKIASLRKIKSDISYLGIASDEPIRIERHTKDGIEMPLVEIGWDEATARKWCEDNGLLSPIYTDSMRGGCWFCHNQGVDQLRKLRKNYPDYWAMLMRWDLDSPITFHADGHSVHDFDRRFALEDEGLIDKDKPFKWASTIYVQTMLEEDNE